MITGSIDDSVPRIAEYARSTGVVLLARERGVALVRRILVCPMLDDRTTTPDQELVPFGVWNYDRNFTGWSALLGDAVGTDAAPPSAAPARTSELSGLARLWSRPFGGERVVGGASAGTTRSPRATDQQRR